MLKVFFQRPLLQRLQIVLKNEKPAFISLYPSQVTKTNLTILTNFHTSSQNRIVVVSLENNYALEVLGKITTNHMGNPTIVNYEIDNLEEFNRILDRNWRVSSASEIVETFKNIKNFCAQNNIDLSDARFDKLVDGVMDNCEHLTAVEMTDLLSSIAEIPPTQTYDSHNFHDLWSCLDDICCWKMVDWSFDTSLEIAKLWYKVHVGK